MPYRDRNNYLKWSRRRHRRNRAALTEFKSKPCVDCNKLYPHYVMEFDHIPKQGRKKKCMGALIGSRSINAPTVIKELAKCELVCANCHKVRTWKRKQQFKQKRSKYVKTTTAISS